MPRILQPLRLLGVVMVIATFLMTMSVVTLVVRRRWARTQLANQILSWFCRRALFALGVRASYKGLENLPQPTTGRLLVGNHLTYVDVLVIAARIPACFVTSVEIKNSPGLGLICRMAGCLFVERRNKMNILNEVSELRAGLSEGLTVAIFPEATSTNGERVLKFRKPLYLSATASGAPVVPFCLNYRRVAGRPIDTESRDNIFWYGDMDFVPHLLRLTSSGGVEVEMSVLPPILTSPESDAGEVVLASQRAVETAYTPVI